MADIALAVTSAGGALETKDFLEAEVTTANNDNDLDELSEECVEAMLRALLETFQEYVKAHGKLNKDVARQLNEMDDLERLMNLIPVHAMLKWPKMQSILEVAKSSEKYERSFLY